MGPDGKLRLAPDTQPLPQLPNIAGGLGGSGVGATQSAPPSFGQVSGAYVQPKAVAFPPILIPHVLDYFDRINGSGSPTVLGGRPSGDVTGDLGEVSQAPELGSLGPDGQLAPPPGGSKSIGDITQGKPIETEIAGEEAAGQQGKGDGGLSADSIDAALEKTPMAGQGAAFMRVGQKYNLDPRLLVAVAGTESGYGAHITRGENNALNNGRRDYPDWESAIDAAAHSIAQNRWAPYDLSNVNSMYKSYCTSGCHPETVEKIMRHLGGDPNAIHYPGWQ